MGPWSCHLGTQITSSRSLALIRPKSCSPHYVKNNHQNVNKRLNIRIVGGVRAAVFGLLKSDDDIMRTITDAVSHTIVKKLLDNLSFMSSLAKNVTESTVLSEIKQEI